MMKVSKCRCEGFSGTDNSRYEEMCSIVEQCDAANISPPDGAVQYIEKYDNGNEDSIVPLRPQIDKGVTIREYNEGKSILIDLNAIDAEIDFIRITHEEFEE